MATILQGYRQIGPATRTEFRSDVSGMVEDPATILDDTMKIVLDIVANAKCPDILAEIICDDRFLKTISAQTEICSIEHELPERPGIHQLQITMIGKNLTHTICDQRGQIIDDVYFSIERLEFEQLDMMPVFCQGRQCYEHDFNGTQSALIDEFYGIIGCNGTVKMEFSQPFFLWVADYLD